MTHFGYATEAPARAAAALAVALPQARREGAMHRFALAAGGRRAAVEVSIDDGWLAFRARAVAHDEPPARLLRLNAVLRGGAKLAAGAEPRSADLRAELPIDPEVDLAARVRAVRAGLAGALRRLAAPPDDPAAASPARGDAGALLAALARATHGLGWPVFEREGGRFAVGLDGTGLAAPAEASAWGDGGVVLRLVLVSGGAGVLATDVVSLGGDATDAAIEREPAPRAPACALALERFLLRVCAVHRLVRAASAPARGADAVWLEAVFEAAPSELEWSEALASLGVATRRCAREAAALAADERLARASLGLA